MSNWPGNDPSKKKWFSGKSLENVSLYESQVKKIVKLDTSASILPVYVCGLTPYDSAHLGHAFTYSAFDLLNRLLRHSDKNISYVQNITDVDDPLFDRARRDGINWKQIAVTEVEKFIKDMQAISIIGPDIFVSVSNEMPSIIKSNQELFDKNFLYQVEKDWYYEIKKIDSKLVTGYSESTLQTKFRQRGGDPDRPLKRNPLDAVIWKSSAPDEPAWDSSLGVGRPGWHIECVSIIEKYLSLPLFIQGGGRDLIFPHHAICSMQAKSLSGKELAKNFLHTGLVSYQGQKMSKSLGNLVFISKLLEDGFSAAAIRSHLISHNWHQDWEWLETDLHEFQERTESWRQKLSKIAINDELIDLTFINLKDNLNTAPIFDYLDNLKVSQNQELEGRDNVSGFISDVLGVHL